MIWVCVTVSKMIVVIMYLMCGVIQTMGRPEIGLSKMNPNNVDQIPSWPQSNNLYLLPKKLKVDDIINVTAKISNTPAFEINLLATSSTSNNSLIVICTIIADTASGIIKILDDKGISPPDEDYIDLLHFYSNDDKSIFNVSFRRRSNVRTHNNNILQITSKTFSTVLELHEMDDLRYLEFTGDNVKVTELEFKFA